MANIKTTESEWSRAKEYFEAGLSLSKIEEKTGISRSALSKKSHSNNWSKETGKDVLIQQDIELKLARETLNETATSVHDELVNDRFQYIQFFNNNAIKNVQDAMADICENQNDYRARADTILKAKEVVLGKTPDTAIQINNNLSVDKKIKDMTDDELFAIASGGGARIIDQT